MRHGTYRKYFESIKSVGLLAGGGQGMATPMVFEQRHGTGGIFPVDCQQRLPFVGGMFFLSFSILIAFLKRSSTVF